MLSNSLRRCAFVVTLLAAAPALGAKPPDGASAEAQQVARTKAYEGLKLYGADRWQEALEAFQEADRLYHAPTLVLYMARCQRKLGRLEVARDLYEQVLAEPLPEDPPTAFLEARQDAETELAGVRAALEATAAKGPSSAEPAPSAAAEGGGSLVPAGVAFGLGAVGLGVGAVTGLVSLSQVSDIRSRCEGRRCPADLQDDADAATTLGHVSTVGFVVGAAAAAAGVVLLVIRPGGGSGSEAAGAPKAAAAPPRAPRGVVWSAGVGLGRIELQGKF
ncbi:tetratricopeptide repeat protein [Sorangium sp. So ce1000]|uniref:tetratricopeptide repeat protein n=1 Tax=Sorangium sp. So ce1000 TaxID=3133325 RepID=UPI003F5E6B1A